MVLLMPNATTEKIVQLRADTLDGPSVTRCAGDPLAAPAFDRTSASSGRDLPLAMCRELVRERRAEREPGQAEASDLGGDDR
jgi:hypothetical protein